MLWAHRAVKLNKFCYWPKTRYTSELPSVTTCCMQRKLLQCYRIVYLNHSKQVWINFPDRSKPQRGSSSITISSDQPRHFKQSFLQSSSLSQPMHSSPSPAINYSDMKDESSELEENCESPQKRQKMEANAKRSVEDQARMSLHAMSAYYMFHQNHETQSSAFQDDSNQDTSINDIASLEKSQTKLNSMRFWDMVPHPKQEPNVAKRHEMVEFTIMSYNILAQQLLLDNRYLYCHCNDQILDWGYRSKNLLKEIVSSNADVLCFQEMESEYYDGYFQPEMKAMGYASLYKKRTGNKNDGCAIFYRTSRFHLETHREVEYRQPGVRMLDRDNIGLIAVLRPVLDNGRICNKPNDPKLCVATTHLLFNPRRGDIKLAQLQIILAELDHMAFKKICQHTGNLFYHPTILCGDMNSEPYSPLYSFLIQGRLNYNGIQSGNISGQSEGCNRGRTMGPDEIELTSLGITSKSQYKNINDARQNDWGYENSGTNQGNAHPIQPTFQNMTVLSALDHAFGFKSAYPHFTPHGAKLITTQHVKANCTVDYIFYSSRKSAKESGKSSLLKLLGTYRLLSDVQIKKLGGLPNAVQSSDHTSLLAKFGLKVPYSD